MVSRKGNTETKPPRVIMNLVPESDTLVILLGWAGCHDRYLKKYADYYEKASISTIRYTTPIRKVRGYPSYHRFAKKFYREVLEKGEFNIPNNIYFHCFSMNGCSTFTAFWDLLDKRLDGDKFKERVQGILFDSGLVWMRSFVENDVYEKSYAYYRMLSIKDLPKRQMYFYGPGDDVCSVDSIDAFANVQEKQGVRTYRIMWKDSLHCQHYRSHGEEYEKCCLDFVLRRGIQDNVAEGPNEPNEPNDSPLVKLCT